MITKRAICRTAIILLGVLVFLVQGCEEKGKTSAPSFVAQELNQKEPEQEPISKEITEGKKDEEPTYNGKPLSSWLQDLQDDQYKTRLEALKALRELKDPSSAPALLKALKESTGSEFANQVVEALVEIGESALEHINPRIIERKYSYDAYIFKVLTRIGPPAVQTVINAFDNPDRIVRLQATKALQEIGTPEAIQALAKALYDEDRENIMIALRTFKEIGEQSVPVLIQSIENKDHIIKALILNTLGEIGSPEAAPTLIQSLEDEEDSIRESAASALGEIDPPAIDAVEPLIHALDDENEAVRANAAEALGKIGPDAKAAIPRLIGLIDDDDYYVREMSAFALREMNDPKAVEPFIQLLKDENPQMRMFATDSLGEIGDKTASNSLIEVMDDEAKEVRWSAVKALRKLELEADRALPIFLKAMQDDFFEIRIDAAFAFGEYGYESKDAREALVLLMKDDNRFVRRATVNSVKLLWFPEIIPALIDALGDEDDIVCIQAAKALRLVRDPAAVPALIRALESKYSHVRSVATIVLRDMEYPSAAPYLLKALQEKRIASLGITLAEIGEIKAIPVLIEILEKDGYDSSAVSSAVKALGMFGSEARDSVPALIGQLQNERSYYRESVVTALGKIGDPTAVPPLITMLEDEPSEQTRGYVARALGDIGDPSAIPALIKAIENEKGSVASYAVEALGSIGDPSVIPILREAVGKKELHASVAIALGELGPEAISAIEILFELLNSRSSYTRSSAAEALSKIGCPDAVPTLLVALGDKDYRVRISSFDATLQIGKPAVPHLMEEIQKKGIFSAQAAELLGRIGDTSVIPGLLEVIDNPEGDEKLVLWCLFALAKMNEDNRGYILKTTEYLNNTNPEIRLLAIKVLGEIGAPESSPVLIKMLESEDPAIRNAAIEALGKIGGSQAVPALINLFEDDDFARNNGIIRSLAEIGDSSAVPVLCKAFESRKFPSSIIARALGDIGDPEAIPCMGPFYYPSNKVTLGAFRYALKRMHMKANE